MVIFSVDCKKLRRQRVIQKVDIVMWAKNGSRTLPTVMRRVKEVFPAECIRNCILADDHSADSTREIAESFGWQVVPNEGSGISDNANTAVHHVESDYFVSLEQDILLAEDWWQRIPPLLVSDPKVAVASGVRVPSKPLGLRKLQQYAIERYSRRDTGLEFFHDCKSLDNTIYKTAIIRGLGGFPSDCNLPKRIFESGYKWKVDYSVESIHIRNGMKDELSHYYWYGALSREYHESVRDSILRMLFSPVRGLHAAVEKNAPDIVFIYPLIRLNILRGMLEGKKGTEVYPLAHVAKQA
jgi:glycosyltransferase involved in cell wall biosynthesis